MPEPGATPGDLASQPPSQQAGERSQPWNSRYDAERGPNARGATAASTPAFVQNPPLDYSDFDAQTAQGQFTGYNFNPSAPAAWDWTQSMDFSDFTAHYEPQGELVQETQNQKVAPNDFNMPLAVNPLSPPRRPRPQGPVVQTSMKRKADSEPDPNSAVSQTASEQQNLSKRPAMSRASSNASLASPLVTDARSLPVVQPPVAQATVESVPPSISQGNDDAQRRRDASKGTGPEGRVIDVSKPRRVVGSPAGVDMLPAGKVFPIQIGSALFRLSGASLSSDAPSYFSHFFSDQLHQNGGRAGDVRTLYIDRDPDTFRDIALHLQGYHIVPRDGEHYVKLFADAQFYSLPRLTKQLFKSDIFIRIGDTPFQIPRDTFSAPGDSPNYFSLGFAQFFSTPSEVFPGLDRSALLRPPSISPPSVPNKSGEIFGELMKMLQGYDIEIRNDVHRAQLLRDARYFHLKGLEQRLIPCDISYNLKRQQSEILLRLEDIRQSGVSFTPDPLPSPDASSTSNTRSSTAGLSASQAPSLSSEPTHPRSGFVSYARPYTDDHSRTHILILETSTSESTTLYLPATPPTTTTTSSSSSSPPPFSLRATFHLSTLSRITSLFSVIAAKMGLPATQPLGLMYLQTGRGVAAQPVSPANSGVSEARVRVRLDAECALEIDGAEAEVVCHGERGRGVRLVESARWVWGSGAGTGSGGSSDSLSAANAEAHEVEWVVKRAHWRVRVEAVQAEGGESRMQVVLCPVRLQAFTAERRRNAARGFLGA